MKITITIPLAILSSVGIAFFGWAVVLPFPILLGYHLASTILNPKDPSVEYKRRIEELESRIGRLEMNQL